LITNYPLILGGEVWKEGRDQKEKSAKKRLERILVYSQEVIFFGGREGEGTS